MITAFLFERLVIYKRFSRATHISFPFRSLIGTRYFLRITRVVT